MKKIIFTICVLCALVAKTTAQAPNQFNYQAVARNSLGQSIPNANIKIRFTILDGSATGTDVYSEVRQLTTNQLGLFTAAIGGTGAVSTTGNFATINWSTGKKFIKVEADPLGGTSFTLLGNTEMLSVPYALYAVNGKVGPQGPQGPMGLTGATGPQGPIGLTGATGATGSTGATGPIGLPGKSTLILTTTEAAGANCSTGGVKQEYGIDANSNNILDATEIDAALTKYICNGLAGTVSNAWGLAGNAGTTIANFIGTTDDQPLRFAVKGGSAGIIDSANANTAFGLGALRNNTFGGKNTALGLNSLYQNIDGFRNTANGYYSLYKNTSGDFNTATGDEALYANTVGDFNTANGSAALTANISGEKNTANGSSALYSNTTGSSNTAIGFISLRSNTTGNENTATGHGALYSNTVGNVNTANGVQALYNNTTGISNTATGYRALFSNTEGFRNTANGMTALEENTIGVRNTGIGYGALSNNTDGNNNTAIGYYSGLNIPVFVNNVTCLGYTTGSFTTASNHINIGNTSVTVIGGQVNWSTYSDGRIKNNIKENVPGLNFIKALRPVTYNLDIIKQDAIANAGATAIKDKDGKLIHKALNRSQPTYPEEFDIEKITQTGFIAQEVEAAAQKTGYNFSGVLAPKNGKGLYSLRYSDFIMPLVKAVQEQQMQIEILEKQNNELLKRLDALENKK
jgi:trimeric autotransporter adhesin